MQSMNSSRILRPLTVAAAGLFGAAALAATPQAATPREQQAIVQNGNGGPEVLTLQTVPVPEPAAGQVLIRVYAAAVNPADWKTRAGMPGAAPARAAIPGGDVAGVVEKLGPGVTTLKVGDPVFAVIARVPGVLNGGYSQFVAASAANIAAKPPSMTYAQASGLGIASITGVRAVNEVRVGKGTRVLITGIAGGVGSAAAQVARARGAYVIGTASARHNDYLKSIGVDQVIDYTRVRFEEHVGSVDAVIDTVGGDTALRAMALLRKGGFFISLAAHDLNAQCAAAAVTCVGPASASQLPHALYEETRRLAADGTLRVKVDRAYPLAQAGQAQVFGEEGHTEGKIVLEVDAAQANRK